MRLERQTKESIERTYPGELGAHFLCRLYHVGGEHVRGSLAVDVAVSCVQSLGLCHCIHSSHQVTSTLHTSTLITNAYKYRKSV